MTLPNEAEARTDLSRQFKDLFERAERVHNAALEVITRGELVIRKPFNEGVVTVVASLYTKACKTYRAIQLTCEAGLGQDAAVLARQLFETTVALAFILQKDSKQRAAMLAAHEDQRRLVLLQECSKVDGLKHIASNNDNLIRAEAKVRAWDSLIGRDCVESVRGHWSARRLEWAAKEVGMQETYTLMFRFTSAFAHGSDVTQHIFAKPGSGVPTVKLGPGDDQIERVLLSSIDLLHTTAKTLNEAFGLGEDDVVARIAAEVRDSPGGAQ